MWGCNPPSNTVSSLRSCSRSLLTRCCVFVPADPLSRVACRNWQSSVTDTIAFFKSFNCVMEYSLNEPFDTGRSPPETLTATGSGIAWAGIGGGDGGGAANFFVDSGEVKSIVWAVAVVFTWTSSLLEADIRESALCSRRPMRRWMTCVACSKHSPARSLTWRGTASIEYMRSGSGGECLFAVGTFLLSLVLHLLLFFFWMARLCATTAPFLTAVSTIETSRSSSAHLASQASYKNVPLG